MRRLSDSGDPVLSRQEADRVVELWLRKRLEDAGADPTLSREYTISQLADTLSVSESEIAGFASQAGRRSLSPKLRPAVPVSRSWRYIAAIYVAVGVIVVGFVGLGRMRPGRYFGSYVPVASYTQSADEMPRSADFPRGFGYEYRGAERFGTPLEPGSPVSWEKAESAILDTIRGLEARDETDYRPEANLKDLEAQLAQGPDPRESESNPPGLPIVHPGDLIEWNRFTLTFDGDRLHCFIPHARVTNPSTERSVQADVKRRIEGLVETFKARYGEPINPKANRNTGHEVNLQPDAKQLAGD